MELEQHERILIVAHQGNLIISHILELTLACLSPLATIRCLYAYFMNLDHDQLPYARVPLHTLIELTPTAYHCEEKYYKGNGAEEQDIRNTC
jgi:6-phosphofructo-2-kinase/fructose-2,6-biphosphatase 2